MWSATVLGGLALQQASADQLSDYVKQQKRELHEFVKEQREPAERESDEFRQYVLETDAESVAWQEREKRQFESFRAAVIHRWGRFRKPTHKVWIEYAEDTLSVSRVDFEKGEVSVAVLVPRAAAEEWAREQIEHAVSRTLSSSGNTGSTPVASAGESMPGKPLLHDQVSDRSGKSIDSANVGVFVAGLMGKAETYRTPAETHRIVEVSFTLTPDHLKRRMMPFLPHVEKYCHKYGLSPAHILAMIHTESHFNPAARSRCNAIGLMQLVPDKGGREAYEFVQGKQGMPTALYLFDPDRNIELGCAYLHLLQTRYFGRVEDRQSRLYCSTAGYNTGPGNVARAFAGERSVDSAIDPINALTPAARVYSCLVKRLPYRETREYLALVVKRVELYR